MRICIISADERLGHRFLSLQGSHTVTDIAHASLVVWDADSTPRPVTRLPILCVTRNASRAAEGDLLLLRPFGVREPEEKIRELEENARLPRLSPTERRLFSVLKEAGEAGIDRKTLSMRVFGKEDDEGLLNVYICYLRKKLEADGRRRIHAMRGKGYKLC